MLAVVDNLPNYQLSSILSGYMRKSSILRSMDLMAIWIPFCCLVLASPSDREYVIIGCLQACRL